MRLSPIGGLFSATNMGATAWMLNQPCLVFTPDDSGRVVVSVMGSILDTSLATQTHGPTSTAPLADGAHSLIAVVAEGSTSTNNQLNAVTLHVLSQSGVLYTYTLGVHRAAATVLFSTVTKPNDGDTLVVNSRTYTMKTSLTGTPAAGAIQNGGATNPADGYTVTVGSKTYRIKDSVSAALAATAILEVNNITWAAGEKTVEITIGGFTLYYTSGLDTAANSKNGTFATFRGSGNGQWELLFKLLHGDYDTDSKRLKHPSQPTAGYDSGRIWTNRRFTTGIATDLYSSFSQASTREVPIRALTAGAAGNDIGVAVTDPNGTWHIRVKAGTTTAGKMIGGADAAAAYDVKRGANWTETRANLVAAINLSGTAGTEYAAGTEINPEVTAALNGDGTTIDLTSKKAGSAGNGTALSQSGATFTLVAIGSGVDGATADQILIGATAATAWQNVTDCLNRTGQRGTQYGDPTTINDDVTAAYFAGYLLLTAKASGAAGNAVTLSGSFVAGAAVSFKDEFRDKTVTTLSGGAGAPPFTVASGARPDQTDLRLVWGGWGQAPSVSGSTFPGLVSDFGLALKALSADEIVSFSQTPPPTSIRDVGWYRAWPPRLEVAVKTELHADWPTLRPLGAAFTQHLQIGVSGARAAVRVEGIEAGRPWSVSRMRIELDGKGGFDASGRPTGTVDFPGFSSGVHKSSAKPMIGPRGLYDLKNISFQGGDPRRRRGFLIRCGDGETTELPGRLIDGTNSAGDSYLYAALGGVLHLVDNWDLLEIDDGYAANRLPTDATVGLKTFVLDPDRQRVVIAGSVLELGVTAPTSAPSFVSSTPNVDGGVIAVDIGYEYVYTNYDGTKLTESGPSPILYVVLPPGTTPSSILLGGIADPGGSITERRVYRRKGGGVAEDFRLVGTVTSGTQFTDDSEIIGSTSVLEVFNDIAVTAEFPAITACAKHENRLIGWGDPSDTRIVYISETGDGERWHLYNQITCEGEVRACVSHEGRLVVFTDRTVEVVEGDWVRGSGGLLGVAHRVLSTTKGCFGPFAACTAGDYLFWADSAGVHRMGRGFDAKDTTDALSWDVDPVVKAAVDTQGSTVVLAYNPTSNELWAGMTQAAADSATKNRVVVTLNLTAFASGQTVWSVHDLALPWFGKINDGLLGPIFTACNYYGQILEMDVTDGDGCQGNESWHPGAAAEIAAFSLTAKTVSFDGVDFSAVDLRGVGVVFKDRDSAERLCATIISNDGDTLTVSAIPDWLAAFDDSDPDNVIRGDLVAIGGIRGMLETGEQDAGSQDTKLWQQLEVGLVDAASGRF